MNRTAVIVATIVVLAIIVIACGPSLRPIVIGVAVIAGGFIAATAGRANAARVVGGSDEVFKDYHGERLTEREVAAIEKVARVKQPMSRLPFLADSLPSLPYRLSPYLRRTALHLGQRKLLLSEVDFLTDHAKEGDIIVYAGAAPGSHLPFLASLFHVKKLRIVAYDPRAFVLPKGRAEALSRIETHQTYFTDKTAELYARRRDVLFISDIRTGETEERVAADMAAQARWVDIMRPRAAMLKFRLPYDSDAPVDYLRGSVRLQAWAPRASTETRLVATRPFRRVAYAPRVHENQMYYLSTVLREWAYYDHGVPTALVPGLDHCFDCALEARIWGRYLGKAATPEGIAKLFNRTSAALSRPLNGHAHGIDPDAFMVDKREQMKPRGKQISVSENPPQTHVRAKKDRAR